MSYNYTFNNSLIGNNQPRTERNRVFDNDKGVLSTVVLPDDILFYAPFQEAAGTLPAGMIVYEKTTPVGGVHIPYTNYWSTTGSGGEMISSPGTHPLGNATTYDPYAAGSGGGLRAPAQLNDAIFGIPNAGLTSGYFAMEYFFYIGTNANVPGGYPRVLEYGGNDPGDGMSLEFGNSDTRMGVYTYDATARSGTTTNLSTNSWNHIKYITNLNTGFTRTFVNGSSLYTGTRTGWQSWLPTEVLSPSRSNGYQGGISELIIRYNEPNASTISGGTYSVPTQGVL